MNKIRFFTLIALITCINILYAQEGDRSITATENINWKELINENKNLSDLYKTNAVKIISFDNVLNGPSEITDHYNQKNHKIKSVESIFFTEGQKAREIYYEIVRVETSDAKEYIQLIIWSGRNGKKLRELEMSEYSSDNNQVLHKKEIAEKRALWIKLCNAHNATELVNQLYSANALYYNHRPLIKGREALMKEYAYMNNANYSLSLEPIVMEFVNENTVFEIGQCKGSYPGKYIIIWKKESDGVWRVYMDSNI